MRRSRRLLRTGTPWEATVTAVEATNVKFNRQPLWRIRYRYRDVSGRERDVRSGYLARAEVEGWKSGDRGAIRIDPLGGGSVWVGRG